MVAACALAPGDVVEIDGAGFAVAGAMTIGHKLARRALVPGEKVIKYGANIGHATAAIPPGAHIHTHNLASDYIQTCTPAPGQLLVADRT